jgi:3-hydroxyacyl-CoA dehydrogenase/enoyl-CoA hydratase/3-hydroxybutyryl-CoA epimerase
MPVGPLAIQMINLNLMLAIMSEDPNLTPHEINLRQTLVSIIETHGRTGKKKRERLIIQ